MDTTWIILADEGRCRILEMHRPGTDLAELEELTDAAAHARNADFRRDAYGRRGGGDAAAVGGRQGGSITASAGEDKLDHEAERFARQIAEHLMQAHQRGRYARLRLAAQPKFLGRLRKALDPQLAKLVDESIDKDWLQLPIRELTQKFSDAHHA